jgi:hypothetical protein
VFHSDDRIRHLSGDLASARASREHSRIDPPSTGHREWRDFLTPAIPEPGSERRLLAMNHCWSIYCIIFRHPDFPSA